MRLLYGSMDVWWMQIGFVSVLFLEDAGENITYNPGKK